MSTTTEVPPAEGDAATYGWLRNAAPLIPTEKLRDTAERLAPGYQTAVPYPHAVIDNLFDETLLDELVRSFPGPKDTDWQRFDAETEIKLALAAEEAMPLPIRLFLYFLNSATFLKFLETLTGIPNLIADPHWLGGGMHQIERHGKLAIHADFNEHDRYNLDRRLNLLLYLNKDWAPAYRGDFEMWDRDMTQCVRKVAPLFNRLVVFSTSETSFHGHPDELMCPRDRTRRSLALYYYTNGRPESEKAARHSTLYRARPGQSFSGGWKRRLKPFIPPILTDLYNKIT